MNIVYFNNGLQAALIDDETSLPVKEVLDYTNFLKNGGRSTNTIITYTKSLCKWYTWCKSQSLDPLKVFDSPQVAWAVFDQFKSDQMQKSLKASSINLTLSAVYNYYNFLSISGVIDHGSYDCFSTSYKKLNSGFLKGLASTGSVTMDKLMYVRPDPSLPTQYISWSQYEQILQACNHDRDAVLIGLLFECGLRVGEALGIRLEDIELENNLINIVYRENNVNKALVKRKAERTVVFSDRLAKRIFHLLLQIEQYNSDYLFITMYSNSGKNGKPMTYTNARDIAKRLSKKSGIPFHLHMLRHGYAQVRKMDGWDTAELSRSMGHSSVESTKIYAEFTREQITRKAKDYLEERINGSYFKKNNDNN